MAVDWKDLMISPPGVADMVGAATHGPATPLVEEVNDQRGMDANGRMEAGWWLPGPIAHPGNKGSRFRGDLQRNPPAIAEQKVPLTDHPGHLNLQSLYRGVNVAYRSPAPWLFPQDMPGFQSLAQLNIHSLLGHLAVKGETEFKMGMEKIYP
jgi:hypothetical protein